MKLIKMGQVMAVSAAFFMFAGTASAQEDDGGPMTQGEDAVYVSVGHVKFKPGKRERGMEIITEYFAAATEAAGTSGPMLVVHYQTGPWDLAAVWEMEGGMADLEWYRSEDDIAWYAALVEIAGGEDEAEAILAEWSSTVDENYSEVGHYHTGEEAEE